MDAIAPPGLVPEVQLDLCAPQLSAQKGPAAEAADKRIAEHRAALRDNAVSSNILHVTLDESAGRFVQTLTDGDTAETVRRYPSEAQLAYSRAVMAYMRSLAES